MWHPVQLFWPLTGGLAYCLTVYTAFCAPAAHAAIFLLMAVFLFCTAVAAYLLFKTFDKHTWLSLSIMSALALMSYLMLRDQATAFGLGDLLFFYQRCLVGHFYGIA